MHPGPFTACSLGIPVHYTRTMIDPMSQRPFTAHPPLRALVVDDRDDVAMGLGLLLKKLGYTVQIAYRAKEALEKGPVMRPDVIFLDIGLPDLSGYDVCKEIRHSEWGLNAFIVAVTGRNEPADVIRSANSGFDRHVGKPMSYGTLKEILETAETRHALADAGPGPGMSPSE